jgi:uncharacterized protein
VKVKVGPIQVIYRGTAEIVEVDHDAHRGRIEARGKETRGAGTASADVVATLLGDGDGTRVVVDTDLHITGKPAQFGRGVTADVGEQIIDSFATDLHITGKPAQFGRGVTADVGEQIIDSFAERLRAMLEEGEEAWRGRGGRWRRGSGRCGCHATRPEAVATGAAAAARAGHAAAPSAGPAGGPGAEGETGPPPAEAGSEPEAATREPGPEAIATCAAAAGPGPRRIAPTPGREDDALDLLEAAGAATAKRVLPLVALLAAIAALVWWLRRR